MPTSEQPPAPSRSERGHLRPLGWIVGAVVLAAVTLWAVVLGIIRANTADLQARLETELSDTTESVSRFVTTWVSDHTSFVEALSGIPIVHAAVTNALEDGAVSDTEASMLWTVLAPVTTGGATHRGFIIADGDGAPLVAEVPDFTWDGASLVPSSEATASMPVTLAVTTGGTAIAIRVWAPVETDAGIAYLGAEMDLMPVADFVVSTVGSSPSRETYLFDREGRLLTPSRFEDQLRAVGLLEEGTSSIGLPVVDPGTNLLDGGVPDGRGALTHMAASATRGESSSNVDGYRDYRGVTVVGAWHWIDDLGIGLTTEVDRAEAFASHEATSRLWFIAAGALTLLSVALAVTFLVTARRLDTATRRLSTLTDDLERQVAERTHALTESESRLRAQMEAKDDLIAAVSHELRTPLSAVIGFAAIIAEAEADLDPTVKDLVDLIVQEGTEMSYIVDDLLAATQAATGTLNLDIDRVDLLAEAESVVKRWNPIEASRITMTGEPVSVMGDASRVRQVLRNLVSNALRHGGPHITVVVTPSPDHALVQVIDDGEPITDDVRYHMFDMYFRGGVSNGLAPSLGIGLGLSRRLAEAMGGDLAFHRSDDGNVFELSLPLVPAESLAMRD